MYIKAAIESKIRRIPLATCAQVVAEVKHRADLCYNVKIQICLILRAWSRNIWKWQFFHVMWILHTFINMMYYLFCNYDWMLYVFPDTKVADKENQHSMAPLHFIAAYVCKYLHISWKRNSFVHHFERTDEEDIYLTSDRTRCATFDFP